MSHPPATPDPDADLSQLLPPRLLAWLLDKGCVAARWTAPHLGAPADSVPVPEGQSVEFNFRIGSDPVVAVGLVLKFRTAGALDAVECASLSNYLVAVGRLLPGVLPHGGERWVSLPWDSVVTAEHQVRNHLNSLLMNASALVILSGEPEGIDVFVEQMQRDVEKCLSLLQGLFDLPP